MDNINDSKEWLSSALIFTRVLSHLLQENEGIVVQLMGDMKINFPSIEKVIVYAAENQIHIVECTEDLVDGQLILMDK